MHLVSFQPTGNSVILFIQRHLFRVRIRLLCATWMLISSFQDARRYERSQFSNANSSASFFELFACTLSSFFPLLPRVTAVGRNRTPWETMPYFHFLASFCVLEWEEQQPWCLQALSWVTFVHVSQPRNPLWGSQEGKEPHPCKSSDSNIISC